jgi:hypothetical protein
MLQPHVAEVFERQLVYTRQNLTALDNDGDVACIRVRDITVVGSAADISDFYSFSEHFDSTAKQVRPMALQFIEHPSFDDGVTSVGHEAATPKQSPQCFELRDRHYTEQSTWSLGRRS